jgi:hypothetical protein
VFAATGDRILVRSQYRGGPVRDAEILEVCHPDGSPPYLVLWSDTGQEGLYFPGEDAEVQHFDHADPTAS